MNSPWTELKNPDALDSAAFIALLFLLLLYFSDYDCFKFLQLVDSIHTFFNIGSWKFQAKEKQFCVFVICNQGNRASANHDTALTIPPLECVCGVCECGDWTEHTWPRCMVAWGAPPQRMCTPLPPWWFVPAGMPAALDLTRYTVFRNYSLSKDD